jgi:TDG/mug DNA glycosylase family protein
MNAPPRVHSFAPIVDAHAEVLILGSMPGQASLTAGQYYAHPQNAFWRIVADLLGFDAAAPYAERVQALHAARIALWDVLQSCERIGSLDSSIDDGTQVANDFRGFYRSHPRITRVFFNGTKAETVYMRAVRPALTVDTLRYARLPSTSPANASIPYALKLEAWRAVVG